MSTFIYPACPQSGLTWKDEMSTHEKARKHPAFVRKLVAINDALEIDFPNYMPLDITSGWRSVEYNAKIGGHPRSNHLHGVAADILCRAPSYRAVLIALCLEWNLSVGIYKSHLHVDLRDRAVVWVA